MICLACDGVIPIFCAISCGVVLVNGSEGVSTPSVFAARKGPYSKPPAWQAAHDFEGFARALKDRSNGLALAAQTVSPVISDVLTALEETEGCALARVSGSGGTCFGLFADPTLAQAAAGDGTDVCVCVSAA